MDTIQTLADAFMQSLRALIEQAQHRTTSTDEAMEFSLADIRADDLAEIARQQSS